MYHQRTQNDKYCMFFDSFDMHYYLSLSMPVVYIYIYTHKLNGSLVACKANLKIAQYRTVVGSGTASGAS